MMNEGRDIKDPVEKDVAEALTVASVRFVHESEMKNEGGNLDFYLPDYDCYVECKAYYTERTAEQIKGKQVILVQGYQAAKALVAILTSTKTSEGKAK